MIETVLTLGLVVGIVHFVMALAERIPETWFWEWFWLVVVAGHFFWTNWSTHEYRFVWAGMLLVHVFHMSTRHNRERKNDDNQSG